MLPVNINLKWVGGLLAVLLIFVAGVWVGHTYFPKTVAGEPVYITKEAFQADPDKAVQAATGVSFPTAHEVATDMAKAKPTDKPVANPDQVIRLVDTKPAAPAAAQTPAPVQQYNIVYDRKWEFGGGTGTGLPLAWSVQYNPTKETGIEYVQAGNTKVLLFKARTNFGRP